MKTSNAICEGLKTGLRVTPRIVALPLVLFSMAFGWPIYPLRSESMQRNEQPTQASCNFVEANLAPPAEEFLKNESGGQRPSVKSLISSPTFKSWAKLLYEQQQRDWAGLCLYRKSNVETYNANTVLIGDSITLFWIHADANFFQPGIINRGVTGQTSSQILGRFRQDVLSLHPRYVHILAGTNDIRMPTADFQLLKRNLTSMIDLAEQQHIGVIVGTIPPPDALHWVSPRVVNLTTELNGWIRETARTRKIALADYERTLSDSHKLFEPDLTVDGLHPNARGYRRMEALLVPLMRGLGSGHGQ